MGEKKIRKWEGRGGDTTVARLVMQRWLGGTWMNFNDMTMMPRWRTSDDWCQS